MGRCRKPKLMLEEEECPRTKTSNIGAGWSRAASDQDFWERSCETARLSRLTGFVLSKKSVLVGDTVTQFPFFRIPIFLAAFVFSKSSALVGFFMAYDMHVRC